MGSVYPRGAKLWLKYRDSDGAWKAASSGFSVGEEKKAQALLERIESKVRARTELGERELGPLTVARYAERWIAERKRRDISTAGDDETRLKLHALPSLGAMKLDEVRPRNIRDLVRQLRASGELAG